MRQVLSLVLALLMVTQAGPSALAADSVATQIMSLPAGTNVEVRLKSKEKLRGARGDASTSGFTLRTPTAGDRQVAFDDVASVQRLDKKSHTTRNVLIVFGIVVVAVVAAVAIEIKNHAVGGIHI